MKFDLSIAILTVASSAAAAPSAMSTFKLKTVSANSDINEKSFNAAQSKIFVNMQNQNANCQNGAQDDATFQLRDGQLFLYATKAAPQQVYVELSTAGQGKTGYFSPGQGAPDGASLDGWTIDGLGHLKIAGVGFVACPGAGQGAWSIYANVNVKQPEGHSGCVKVEAKAVDEPKPLSCHYTEIEN